MKLRWIALILVVGILIVAAGVTALVPTDKYTLKATIPIGIRSQTVVQNIPDLRVDKISFTSDRLSLMDYILQGKGHGGITYKEAYLALWMNLTDSAGKEIPKSWAYTWTRNSTDVPVGSVVLKFVNVSPGNATILVTTHYRFVPESQFIVPAYEEIWHGMFQIIVGE